MVTATAVFLELVCVQAAPSEFALQLLLATNTQTPSARMVVPMATAINVLPTQNVAAETLRRNVLPHPTDTSGIQEPPASMAV